MKKEYTIKQVAETRWFYEFTEKNDKQESLTIELSLCEDSDFKNSIPKLWYKNGFTNIVLQTYWGIQTYVTDSEGAGWGSYNPQHKLSSSNKGQEINFDWMFEATEENKEKLISEVLRQFTNAQGKTATVIKKEKLKKYATEKGYKIYTTLPKGWKRTENSIAGAYGTIPISNGESFRSGKREEGLLLRR